MKQNLENCEKLDFSKEYTYNNKKIYISHETKKYIICSFNENGIEKFKLDKTEFNKKDD